MLLHLLTLAALLGWVYLFFFNGRFWRLLVFKPIAPAPAQWPDVSIVVPARDEAESLPLTLPALLQQDYPGNYKVILVDDRSTDGTGDIARKIAEQLNAAQRLHVVAGTEPLAGWKGKVNAMQAGYMASSGEFILFTDADIKHPPASLRHLVAEAEDRQLAMLSLMVKLRCVSVAEKLLIPAFVYFFQLLYPFRHANDRSHPMAAAAGGVMLVRRSALVAIDGLTHIRDELIDDCALAKVIKHESTHGCYAPAWLGLSEDVESLRVYDTVWPIWQMIARTAFTQLHHSALMLVGCVLGLSLMFIMPFWALLSGSLVAFIFGAKIMLFMVTSYRPMVKFYGLTALHACTLPIAALIYLAATVDSARLYWQGRGGQWKGRAQAANP